MEHRIEVGGWRQLLADLLLPGAVTAGLLVFLGAPRWPVPLEVAVSLLSAATLALAMLAERLLPYREEWNRSLGDVTSDLFSAAALLGLVEPLLKYLAPIGMVSIYAVFDVSGIYRESIGQLPLWVQLLIVALLLEWGRYWMHRWHHQSKVLWWLHAMHHSSRRLYAFNNLRFHPLNHALNFLASVVPLMLIGTPAEILLGYLAISQPVLMLQHANVASRNGWLNYLLSTNELHRWHHSQETDEANCNYGSALIVWDMVFGTFRYRPGRNNPQGIGLFSASASNYPANGHYLAQLVPVVHRQCCVGSAAH